MTTDGVKMKIGFTIPGTPQGKGRPRFDGRGAFVRVHTSGDDIKREKEIRRIAREVIAGTHEYEGYLPTVLPVRVTIEATFEVTPSWTKKRKDEALQGVYHVTKPDADNIAKSVLDGLLAGPKSKRDPDPKPWLIVDDTQVAELLVRKRYGSPARTEVVVETIGAGLL